MDARRAVNQPDQNPYVGPRPFSRQDKDKFFGREREGRDLLSLVISERLVLFYSQSGAGKTSLINTRLVPGLEARNFEVLPVGRVSGELPPGLKVENIFTTNLMLQLDMGEDDPTRFRGLSLAKFLVNLVSDGKVFYYRPASAQEAAISPAGPAVAESQAVAEGEYKLLPRALIIDQFEELFTTHPEAWDKREAFMKELADAMQEDPYLWVVLALREDHIAELEPYASLMPGGLRARYYMQRMDVNAALEAVTQPVARLREFEPQAAKELVVNLSRISAGRDERGVARFVPGEFIEPVQLQVVCYQLWEDLRNLPGDKITKADLNRLARGQDLGIFVNQALADFYRDSVQKVLRVSKARVSEKQLREWFAHQLITEAKTRGFVFMGEHTTGGIPNEIVSLLEGQLLRGESRAGGKWYELVHDRFIDPILQSNQEWALTQQRTPSKILVTIGLIALIIVLGSVFVSNYFASQARKYSEQVVVQASLVSNAIGTSDINATQAEDALRAAKTSRADVASLYQDQAAATSTLVALENASTAQAVQAQLLILEATTSYGTLTPTGGPVLDTPTPTLPPEEGTPSLTPDFLATGQAATAIALKSQLEEIKATQTALANPIRELIIGQTVKGTPIRAVQLGTGTRNIVLVGGMHAGFAPGTRRLAEEILAYYTERLDEIPPEIKLHIITNANPDSPLATGEKSGRLNSNGVDLNRNWDCDWRQRATWGSEPISGGTAPFSELETQALAEYFDRTQPVAVVFWEARARGGQASPGGCGMQSLFSESLAQIYGKGAGYKAIAFEAYAVNGDATNWLDAKGIPAISVLLPDYDKTDLVSNLKAVQFLLESYSGNQ